MHYEKMLLYLIYVIYPYSASKMTYVVSGVALNSTHSLTHATETRIIWWYKFYDISFCNYNLL